MPSYSSILLTVVFAGSALAQTSLFLPGFDPQPLSADILGTDAEGRTTWAIHAGAKTGTFDDASFPGTATLVEGPNDASFTYAQAGVFTTGIACSLSGNTAVCSGVESGMPVTVTDTFTRIEVQAGTTAPLASPTGAPSGNTGTTGNTLTTKPSNSQTAPTTSTQTTSTTKQTNGARILAPYLLPLFAIAPAVAVFSQL